MTLVMSSLSTRYILQPVYVTLEGQPYDPTGDPVQFAFQPPGSPPAAGDWSGGEWWTAQQPDGGWVAQILVGPAAPVTLTPGSYAIWCRVTDNPEIPVDVTGRLEITP